MTILSSEQEYEHSVIQMDLTLDQALERGIEAHMEGQVQDAEKYYTAILKANPKHPDANHNMGILAVGGKVEVPYRFLKPLWKLTLVLHSFG